MDFNTHKKKALKILENQLEHYLESKVRDRQSHIQIRKADCNIARELLIDSNNYNCNLFDKTSPYIMSRIVKSGFGTINDGDAVRILDPISYYVEINHVLKIIKNLIIKTENELDLIFGDDS